MEQTKSFLIQVIELLKIDTFYGVGENIDIAKGRNELPVNWKGIRNTVKRNKKYK